MNKGNKTLGAILVISLACSAVVAAFEERAYVPNEVRFEVIQPDEYISVNINTATESELQQLDGVGERIAQRIIDFRTKTRPFETIYDVKLVRGVGEKMFDNNKNKITVK